MATLHHLEPVAALDRMRTLLRPGGRLVVVGLARSSLPRDLPREVAGLVAHRMQLIRNYWGHSTYWEHAAPMVWPPPHT